MTHVIRFHEPGGPDVLKWEEVPVADPGPGDLRIRHTAVGLNYIDTYHRSGLYPLPMPSGIGLEAAGVVEAIGSDVADFQVGDRVAYGTGPIGAYSEERIIPAGKVVKLPESIDDRTAAAMMLQGMTVEYLTHRTYKVQPGDTVLFHAAAGGVGLIACQWLSHMGVTVIGTVGSEEKAALAKAHGCHHTILYRQENIVDRVKELTDGKGVPVVYDSVGKDTYMASLDSLRPLGMLVSFGQASGPIPPMDLGILAPKGSLYVTRPTLMTYCAETGDMRQSAQKVMDVIASGAVKIEVNQDFPLKDAVEAHRSLEGRKTTGSTVMIP